MRCEVDGRPGHEPWRLLRRGFRRGDRRGGPRGCGRHRGMGLPHFGGSDRPVCNLGGAAGARRPRRVCAQHLRDPCDGSPLGGLHALAECAGHRPDPWLVGPEGPIQLRAGILAGRVQQSPLQRAPPLARLRLAGSLLAPGRLQGDHGGGRCVSLLREARPLAERRRHFPRLPRLLRGHAVQLGGRHARRWTLQLPAPSCSWGGGGQGAHRSVGAAHLYLPHRLCGAERLPPERAWCRVVCPAHAARFRLRPGVDERGA
mmetsp:Transcript_58898/g.149211  ORF Transcript_58898/g.149211 Transcript_58898/m.149211 type:complete len:259 (+) Transcript_58898:507-1283(+)